MSELLTCPICQTKFIQKIYNQTHCSRKCTIRAKQLEYKSIKQLESKPLHTYNCNWCGKTFESAHAKKFCSTTCMHYARGTRKNTRQNKTASELARINQLARDAGLSYGKYVGQEYAKLISHNTKENEK